MMALDPGLFDDLIPAQQQAAPIQPQPAQSQPTQEAYSAATPQQQQFLAANNATYDRSGLDPKVTFDTPQSSATDTPHVTQGGVLVTPGVDAQNNIFSDLAARRKDDLLGFEQMALKPLDNAASWLENGLGAIGVPVGAIDKGVGLPSADAVKQAHLDYLKQQAAVGVDPGVAGQIAGGVVGTLPLSLIPGGALTQGALGGAALSDHSDAQGIALDAGIGAVGGKVGEGIVKGVQGVISPVVGEAQQYLLSKGIRLTPGQIGGGWLKELEDKVDNTVPLLGSLVRSGRIKSIDDFNRAAVNDTLSPIGESLPNTVATGHDAVAHATDKLGDAYNDVLDKITNVQPDAQFRTAMSGIGTDATSGIMPDAQVSQFQNIIQQRVLNRLDADSTGRTVKLVDSDLGQLAASYSKSTDVGQRQLGDSLSNTQSELRALIGRQNPDYASRLSDINAGWARLVRVRNAAGAAGSTTGKFSPAQFNSAVVTAAGRSQASQGAGLMQDLSKYGKEVLPSSVPDSGTAGRHVIDMLAGAMLGGGAHATHIDPIALGAAGVAAAPYLGVGPSVVRAAMTSRPAAAKAFADYLSRFQAPAAAGGRCRRGTSGQRVCSAMNATTPTERRCCGHGRYHQRVGHWSTIGTSGKTCYARTP